MTSATETPFPFYAERFVAGTDGFTSSEVGGYILLLCYQWRYGSVPGDNMKKLTPIMRCTPNTATAIWNSIGVKFRRGDDGRWRNQRLEDARTEQNATPPTPPVNLARSAAGKKGAQKRWPAHSQSDSHDGQPDSQTEFGLIKIDSQTIASGDLATTVPSAEQSSFSGSVRTLKEKEKKDTTKTNPVKDFLTLYEELFVQQYGSKPVSPTGKDIGISHKAIRDHGLPRAIELLRQFFHSSDKFITGSGHPLGIFATVQNKLIAELSGRAPRNDGRDWAREWIANG